MPGRGSYGPGGKWIHDRAHHIMDKNPEMPKGMAYAVATQQGHKVGKSPKGFRTKEGVRTARAKHSLPKKMYKKTASQKTAFDRLKALQKEAAEAKRVVRFGKGQQPTYRMPTVRGTAKSVRRGRRKVVHVPQGMQVRKRGRVERALLGRNASPVAIRRARGGSRLGRIAEGAGMRIAEGVADRIRAGGRPRMPAAMPALTAPPSPSAAAAAAPSGAVGKALKNPKLLKALKFGGLGALGLGAGAAAHGVAHSVGLTETGPADTLADIVVPGGKYSYDRKATRELERSEMYISRYYLEKAAAAMAGAVDSNDSTMHEGEPGMFGPEASVIPQQTLETVVPISKHTEDSDERTDKFIHSMFERYKSTQAGELSIGHKNKEFREVPLSKQAGRLAID